MQGVTDTKTKSFTIERTDNMTLGNRIRNRREELGLTQPELAQKSRLTQGYISRIENDGFVPKAATLIVLAISLDLAPNEFLKDERRVS